MFNCKECDRTFSSSEQKRAHVLDVHSAELKVTVQSEQGSQETIIISRVKGVFQCPSCPLTFQGKSGCRRHLQSQKCTRNRVPILVDNVGDTSGPRDLQDHRLEADCTKSTDSGTMELKEHVSLAPVAITIATPSFQLDQSLEQAPKKCSHDEAVLYACEQSHCPEADMKKTLVMAEAWGLVPFALNDSLGNEQNFLGRPNVIAKISTATLYFKKKRLEQDTRCTVCRPISSPGLDTLLSMSPYASVLQTRRFVEINKSVSDLLNEDWDLNPQYRFACALVLAGSILLQCNSGTAVILNTCESYGRTKSVDAHRELSSVKKGVPTSTSLPPIIGTRYEEVWPTTMSASDGPRLVIGTQSCNVLVTSCLRLDTLGIGSVGGSTTTFQLTTAEDSKAIRVFLDLESVESAFDLARDKNAWTVSKRSILYQLRQLRSKFHDASTYSLCRASGYLTRYHVSQPYSVFTLANFDQSQPGSGAATGSLFKAIAMDVIKEGKEARLDLSMLKECRAQCGDTKIASTMDAMIGLYSPGTSSIPIIDNRQLNKELESLAADMSSYIATANKSAFTHIEHTFTNTI